VEASVKAIRERFLADRAKEALGLYNEMAATDQSDWLYKFKQSPSAKGLNLSRGLATAVARSAFSMWFAEQQWPEPTDSDLLAFAAVTSMQKT
jgi:hypothetical protein